MREEYTKKRKNQHIKLSERIKIEVGLATNQSIRSIAKQLRRSVSSIYQHAAESLVWRCLLIEKLDIIGWLK